MQLHLRSYGGSLISTHNSWEDISITTVRIEPEDGDSNYSFSSSFELLPPPAINCVCIKPTPIKTSLFRISEPDGGLDNLFMSTFYTACSIIFPRAVRNLLATDPEVVDLLLICVAAVSQHHTKTLNMVLDFLPRFPIRGSKKRIAKIVNNMPSLCLEAPGSPRSQRSTSHLIWTPTSPRQLSQAYMSILDPTQRKLLNYLLSAPFAVLASVNAWSYPHLSFPSLTPYAIFPFIVTKQPGNKEATFRSHLSPQGGCYAIPTFHGTHPSRLPLILTQGLQNKTDTKYQSHGKANGGGIYLASDHYIAMHFSAPVMPWRESQWNPTGAYQLEEWSQDWLSSDPASVQVLLACDFAYSHGKPESSVYVVKDASLVVVRFAFLVVNGEPGRAFDHDVAAAIEALRNI